MQEAFFFQSKVREIDFFSTFHSFLVEPRVREIFSVVESSRDRFFPLSLIFLVEPRVKEVFLVES